MEPTTRGTKGELACDPCRLLKVKCLRDSNDSAKCRKCMKSGATCTWATPHVRTRKPRPSRSSSRIVALEAKIDHLLTLVDEQVAQVSTSTESPVATSSSQGLLTDYVSPSESSDVVGSTLFDRFELTEDMAEIYLRHFRNMTLYFPFVVVPASTSAGTLAREKPMLCLAILAASTSQNRDLQAKLENTLRKSLVEKMMVSGEKNLELLAALLVYLGWCHFYYVPKRDSMAQFMGLAVSICQELGLGLEPEAAARRGMQVRLEHYEADKPSRVEHDRFFSGEARRLYLGTCFLANGHSWAFSENARFTDIEHIVSCASSLAQENEYATDNLILCLLRMQCVAQRLHATFTDIESFETDLVQLNAQLDHVEETLMNIKCSLPPLLRHSALIDLEYYFALMYAYEADTINPLSRKRDRIKHPDFMNAVMERCLHATKSYFETFFTIPVSEYPFLAAHQWLALVVVITILYRLSLGLPRLPSWNVQIARCVAPLEAYLEQCCKTVVFAQRINGSDICAGTQRRKDLYSLLGVIIGDVLVEYNRRKGLGLEERMAPSSAIVHRKALTDDHDTDRDNAGIVGDTVTMNMYRHPCPAYIYWKSQ